MSGVSLVIEVQLMTRDCYVGWVHLWPDDFTKIPEKLREYLRTNEWEFRGNYYAKSIFRKDSEATVERILEIVEEIEEIVGGNIRVFIRKGTAQYLPSWLILQPPLNELWFFDSKGLPVMRKLQRIIDLAKEAREHIISQPKKMETPLKEIKSIIEEIIT